VSTTIAEVRSSTRAAFDKEKCLQRNRIAARRDGVNAAPLRLYRQLPASSEPDGLRYAHGTLPRSTEEALERINASLDPDAPTLTAEDVYILYAEAANNNFIEDRYWFLDATTLRNIARSAAAGVAFMNSHRTGGLSHQSELPFGKTFAGRYEEYKAEGDAARPVQRAVVGIYMVRGIKPNGDGGPSTDDLYRMVTSGTLFDVSVGLGGGSVVCDVCSRDADSSECNHMPGTTRNMNSDQQAAQRARGVKGGKASYTLVDAYLGEVSAVYDGAVPGAGFRKALRFAREQHLTVGDVAQLKQAYAGLLQKGDLAMAFIDDENILDEMPQSFFEKLADKLGFSGRKGEHTPQSAAEVTVGKPEVVAAGGKDLAQFTAELQPLLSFEAEAPDPRVAELEAKLAAVTERQRLEAAQSFTDGLITSGKLMPYGRAALVALHAQFALDDETAPVVLTFKDGEGRDVQGGRADLLRAAFGAAPPHQLTKEQPITEIPAGALVLAQASGKAPDDFEDGRKQGEAYVNTIPARD
jgi:hypothetical protein